MTEATRDPRPNGSEDEVLENGIPIMRQILDNPFLLLFLGIATPTVPYILVMRRVHLPPALRNDSRSADVPF